MTKTGTLTVQNKNTENASSRIPTTPSKDTISSELPMVRYRLLSHKAYPLEWDDIGYSLRASAFCRIPAHGRGIVKTDLAVNIPPGYFGLIHGRFRMSRDSGVSPVDGSRIHSELYAPLQVVVLNYSNIDYAIKGGDRFATLVVKKQDDIPSLKQVKVVL